MKVSKREATAVARVEGLAHDLNNLLAEILGYNGLLLDRVEGKGPLAKDLRVIKRAAQRAARLTDELTRRIRQGLDGQSER